MNQKIRAATPKTLISLSNYIEKIDDVTFRQICSKCGGKGFYRHCDLTNGTITTEMVNCDCEQGFRYGKQK